MTTYTQGGRTLSDVEAELMGLPIEPSVHVENIHVSPPNYWATGPVAAASVPQPSIAPAQVAACDNIPDICNVGFVPWCNGGVGKVSPGGIAETATGCRGTDINYGGPGVYRPDNSHVRVSYWNSDWGSCNDLEYEAAPALDYVIDVLNANDRVMPPPFEFVRTDCDTNDVPRGYGLCPNGFDICPLPQGGGNPTLVDVLYQYAILSDVPQNHQCTEARNAQSGRNRADSRTIGCTVRILERDSQGPRVREWNNGWATQSYWTLRGTIVIVDTEAVRWAATRPASELDRGGLNQATREWYFYIHTTAHELGHSIGLEHAYVGPDGSPRWIPHNRLPNAMSPNPNIVPFSVMHPMVPAAPYTTALWSSGLLSNLVGWDSSTTGGGNAEGWRLSNQFRTTNDGFISYPRNTFAPPLTATNNEL
jgi:hypothetical protein